ncbi:YraN family protein [Aestuariivita sp.]|jgi:putative endonuclease|uniref:YraN family protein n=1 Tax=Aestuariivita sp. TaxID=1872407 RepID=UPI0021738381|nr:YraN family protein [Aestuariivita sp.]MCE8007581.1 hypothetical protein [Aestuariivita sp.]
MIGTLRERGRASYHAGLSAEDRIERAYTDDGHTVLARRWRGRGGEIDLVLCKDDVISFVEVKKARDFARAAESLRPSQARRIATAAEEFLATQPRGALTECSFDVGLVDQTGAYEIIENALLLQ